jgi:hypothetical protein
MGIQLVHNWNIWEYDGNIWVLPSKLRLKKPTAGLTIKNIWNQPMNDGYLDASWNELYIILYYPYIYIHIYIHTHIYIYGNFNFEDLWDHWTIKNSSDLGGACRSSWDHWIFGWKGLLSDIYSLLKQTSDLSEKISLGLYRSPKLENFGRTLLDQMNKRPRRSMQKPYLRGLANYILR